MKKVVSTAIAVLFLLQNLAFAQVNSTSHIINCSKNTEDSFCKSINITKEQVSLESKLKKYYSVYLITIENNGNNTIEVIKTDNNASNALKNIKDSRKCERFPMAVIEPAVVFIVLPLFIPMGIEKSMSMGKSFPESVMSIFSKESLAEDWKCFCVKPFKGTILAPYYLVKDPIDDKKMEKEISKFKTKPARIIIIPNEKIQFAIISNNEYRNLSESPILLINDIVTGKTYGL